VDARAFEITATKDLGSLEMKLFAFNEFEYYSWGLRLGIEHLLRNGLVLRLKKTAGKIAQPINSYTRFLEYHLMHGSAKQYLEKRFRHTRPVILDVGSPKLLAARGETRRHGCGGEELGCIDCGPWA
jgi:hypothetical protein